MGGVTGTLAKLEGKRSRSGGEVSETRLTTFAKSCSDLSYSPATWRQGVPPPTLLSVLVHTSHVHLPAGEPLSPPAIFLLSKADQMVRAIPS